MPMNRALSALLLACFLALPGCGQSPVGWWNSVNRKAGEITDLERRHAALEKEHRKLRAEHFRLESELAELKARITNEEMAERSLEATGSITGRHPASIPYKVPRGLGPEALHALAFEHMRERRFAEAAVTFEEFLAMPEAATLQDSGSLYSAGIAWFQVGNFKKSKEHLEAAKASASGEQKEKIRKKVDLWMRVIDRKLASADHGG